MHKIYLIIIGLFLNLSYTFAQYDSIYVDGNYRTYLLHLPTNYTAIESYPLVVAMHGGFGSATNLQNQSTLSIKADQEDFIVVYPEGKQGGVLNVRTWNAGWCCGNSSINEVDDVGFIDALLDTLSNEYSINSDRIYATGMSNGGFMSYRLACELSDRIAAIAPVACSISTTECEPIRPVPIIQIHSYLDENVPYLGGVGNGISNHYNPPHDSLLNAWANLNTCSNFGEVIVDNAQYKFSKWSACDCETEIHYYITQDGGHSWAGGNSTILGDPVSNHLNATDLMWAFFEAHKLDCNSTATIDKTMEEGFDFTIFPNPSCGNFKVEIPETISDYQLIVQDQFGKTCLILKNENYIRLEDATIGLYYISLQTKENRLTKKLILK